MTDVIIVNWLTGNVVRDSLRVLAKEPDINVILVNVEEDAPVHGIFLPENKGVSVARNLGLMGSWSPRILLLDGDIQYVKGSVKSLNAAMDTLPDAGCVGFHNSQRWDGTRNREEADVQVRDLPDPKDDFPMAWTQYGLFDGKFLREHPFVTEGPFGEPGNGYEDDWLYRDMLAAGLKSYYVDGVLYYHEAHSGNRNLAAKGLANRNAERKALFNARWGKAWHE